MDAISFILCHLLFHFQVMFLPFIRYYLRFANSQSAYRKLLNFCDILNKYIMQLCFNVNKMYSNCYMKLCIGISTMRYY